MSTPDRMPEPSALADPDGAPLTEDLSFLLARANALSLAAANTALAEYGLRVRSYSVLALAVGDAHPTQRELAELLRLDPSQIVSLIDDLENKGLVERRPAPADRRTNVVVATEKGQNLLPEARATATVAERSLHGRLSLTERTALTELLKLIAFPT